jgi:hypothetical protein
MDIVGRELDHEADILADLDELARALDETQVLLRYAGQAGIEVQADAVSALMHAKICVETRRVPANVAVEFYAAYARLAARVAPVTIDTLRVSEEKTRVRLRQYGIFSVSLAVIVVIFSVLTFVTTSMMKDIEDGIGHGNELAVKLRDQVGAPRIGNTGDDGCGPTISAPDPPIALADTHQLVTELQDFAATIRGVLKTALKLNFLLLSWEGNPLDNPDAASEWRRDPRAKLQLDPALMNFRKDSLCKITTYEDVRDFAQNVRTDTLAVYGALAAYFLPVLYALLGAYAYNLRDFSERVKRRTYHPSSYANSARTIVAMTAGAIISVFNNFGQAAALSPLALAFLVGYGVEVFFAFLDTLLGEFQSGRHGREGRQATS